MKADTRFLRHWLPESCSSASVVLLVWFCLPLTFRPTYLKIWWACPSVHVSKHFLCWAVCARLQFWRLEASWRRVMGHVMLMLRYSMHSSDGLYLSVPANCVRLHSLSCPQVGLFPGGDPRDRQKTRMVPHCRNPIFLQTFSLWVFKKVFIRSTQTLE